MLWLRNNFSTFSSQFIDTGDSSSPSMKLYMFLVAKLLKLGKYIDVANCL